MYDREMDIKNWIHPAKQITIIKEKETAHTTSKLTQMDVKAK